MRFLHNVLPPQGAQRVLKAYSYKRMAIGSIILNFELFLEVVVVFLPLSLHHIYTHVNLIKIFRSEVTYCIFSIQRKCWMFDESCSCLHTNTLLDSFLILTDTVNVYNISLSIEMFLLTLLTLLALVRLCCWPYWIL